MPVNTLIAAAAGAVLGFLAGLGVGGGSLLILWLTMVAGMDLATARGINLLFFLPAAGISILFRHRQGKLKFETLIPGILGGSIAAVGGSHIGMQLDLALIRRLFGVLLLITGLRELLYKPRKS